MSSSSAGEASITNFNTLSFKVTSTAGSSVIDTVGGALTQFGGNSTGESAQFITEAGGRVDFSSSASTGSRHKLTAGSIAGAGSYELGADQLTVGLDGLSGDVSGLIDDSGDGVSLVRVTGWIASLLKSRSQNPT